MEYEMARKKRLKLRNTSKYDPDGVVVDAVVFWLQSADESADDCLSLIH